MSLDGAAERYARLPSQADGRMNGEYLAGLMGKIKLAAAIAILFSIIALVGGPGQARGDSLAALDRALESWDVKSAEPLSRQTLIEQNSNPKAHELAAMLHFYRGDYASAADHLNEAIKLGGDEEKLRAHLDFTQDTIEAISGLKPFESPHFKLYLDEAKDGVLVDYTLDALERFYSVMHKDYGFKTESKIRVELFPDARLFYKASTLSIRDIEVSGAIGLCKFNKIMLLSPRALLRGYRWLDAVSHEYVHYVIVRLSENQAPIWFHEGLAKYEEARWRSESSGYLDAAYESLLAAALSQGDLISFRDMEPSLVKLETPHQVSLAYAESASALDFIIERVGRAGVKEIMARLAKNDDREAVAAAEAVMGLERGSFGDRWLDFLKGKNLKEVPGADIHRYKVVRGERGEEEDLSLEAIKSATARNHVRLGDMLKARGRIKPSIIEYRRGLDRNPGSPFIMSKLANSLIMNAEFEGAIVFLKKAVAIDGDNPALYKSMGIAQSRLNRQAEAAEAFWESLQINPFDPEVHRYLLAAAEASDLRERVEIEKQALKRLSGGVR